MDTATAVTTKPKGEGDNGNKKRARPRRCNLCKRRFQSGNDLHEHLVDCFKDFYGKPGERVTIHVDSKGSPSRLRTNNETAKHTNPPISRVDAHLVEEPDGDYPPTSKVEAHLVEDKNPPISRVDAHLVEEPDGDAEDIPRIDQDWKLINSTAPQSQNPITAFRSWHFATIQLGFAIGGLQYSICVDSGCTMTIIDADFLHEVAPTLPVIEIESPIRVRGIGASTHISSKYVQLPMYVVDKDRSIVGCFHRPVHIVNDMRAKLLIGMDVIGPEGWMLDFRQSKVTFPNLDNISVKMAITSKDNENVRRFIRASRKQIIPPKTVSKVYIRKPRNLPDRDYLFEPSRMEAYASVMEADTNFVLVSNESEAPLLISEGSRLGRIHDLYEDDLVDSYLTSPEDFQLAKGPPHQKQQGRPAASLVTDNLPSTKIDFGINVYGDDDTVAKIREVVMKYPLIWQNTGRTVKIPEEEWMEIKLKDGWEQEAAKLTHKVYPMSDKAQAEINKVFDELHAQGKMSWSDTASPFGFPVFVVYKDVFTGPERKKERKARVVVDIRGLNKMVEKDSYPMPLQKDILAAIAGALFISVCDATGFYHQWLVALRDRYKLTINSQRGQEHYNVAPMGFINSAAYVQRKMDKFTRRIRKWVRVFIDDLAVFSMTLEDHLNHLNELFAILEEYHITLNPHKTFLGFPSATVLGQRVNGFGLSTTQEKVEAVQRIQFPTYLNELEYFIGMTGWLRDYCPWFAQISHPLESLKAMLLKHAPPNKRGRTEYCKRTKIVASDREIESFYVIKNFFGEAKFLIHVNPQRILFIDIDASKRGFGVIIYHIKGEIVGYVPPKDSVEPIMFLSKLLNKAESNYWATECEVACLVWTLRKVRHHIESCQRTIVYTDHQATTDIVKATSLNSSSTDKLNLRLIRASQYASQFHMEVLHKPGPLNIVPDALSRLLEKWDDEDEEEGILDIDAFFSEQSADPLHVAQPVLKKDQSHPYGKWHSRANKHTSYNVESAIQSAMQTPIDTVREVTEPEPGEFDTTNSFRAYVDEVPDESEEEAKLDPEQVPLHREDLNPRSLPNRYPTLKDHPLYDAAKRTAIEERIKLQDDIDLLESQGGDTTKPAYITEAFKAIVVELSDEFKTKLKKSYNEDKTWDKVFKALENMPKEEEDVPTGVGFMLRNNLIYHVDEEGKERLCIPKGMEQEIFESAHDEHSHAGFNRTYANISSCFYIRKLSRRLRRYIQHCPKCLRCQTKRHRPYGYMQPNLVVPRFGHTITIDLIMGLPRNEDGYNCAMTVTDRYTKKVMIIPGKDTWGASEWGVALINAIVDWGLPRAVIMDRDPRFINELWRAMFRSLSIKFLATTAYHPQSDGQSERTNQTVEIALRFFFVAHPGKDWVPFLPHLRAMLNNMPSASTGHSANEICYGHNTYDQLTVIADDTIPETQARTIYRQEAKDAIDFANMTSKIRYDMTRKRMNLRKGDKAFITLHKGYNLPGGSRKTTELRRGPFEIVERVGTLAYRLKLPPTWNIHDVISIAMLEPGPKGKDPYNRDDGESQPPPVADDWRDSDAPSWEIEGLVNRRFRTYGRGKPREEFYVKWIGYGPEHNTWYGVHDLYNAMEYVNAARKKFPLPEDNNATPQGPDKDDWEDVDDDSPPPPPPDTNLTPPVERLVPEIIITPPEEDTQATTSTIPLDTSPTTPAAISTTPLATSPTAPVVTPTTTSITTPPIEVSQTTTPVPIPTITLTPPAEESATTSDVSSGRELRQRPTPQNVDWNDSDSDEEQVIPTTISNTRQSEPPLPPPPPPEPPYGATPPKKGRGRPKKAAPKQAQPPTDPKPDKPAPRPTALELIRDYEDYHPQVSIGGIPLDAPRKRGRPKGSKNKKKGTEKED